MAFPGGKSFRLKVTFGSLAVGIFVAPTVFVLAYAGLIRTSASRAIW
jgi:hypothetical protein